MVNAVNEVSVALAEARVPDSPYVQVYLSRRNLETLLAKLDVNKLAPGESKCTLIKNDMEHPRYPQSHPIIAVTAIEDDEYYVDREPGKVLHFKSH